MSKAIREAMEPPRCYAEPDPRVDLGGDDFARKLVIIGRICGRRVEREMIEVEDIVPDRLKKLPLGDFVDVLEELDPWTRERMERAIGEDIAQPHPLVITIEEAHKFLNQNVAHQTIFGTIAREMRKYNVSLLVIDQRPSSIDDEVMSQIGTKITCLLDNEKDVDSVLAGVSGKSELKSVLSRLESRQQALIFGHAVPVPVVVRTRDYGSVESYKDFISTEEGKQAEKDIEELWG